MKVLVAYASRHGATAGIAERVADSLRAGGLGAEAHSAGEVSDLTPYDAFVVGGATYMFHWLKDATAFVKRNAKVLAERPVWLFTSGPLGTDLIDEKGRDVFETSMPKEFAQLQPLIRPRGIQNFRGAWDPEAPAVGFFERFIKRMPAAEGAFPVGDFREWDAIDAWAVEIASDLRSKGAEET